MIGYLNGHIIKQNEHYIILEVQGIGYVVYVNEKRAASWGEHIALWIETVYKEHQTELYGFEEIYEQNTFLQLQKVPGVGPKMAMSILSSFDSINELYSAIQQKNMIRFKNISGIGTKLASRIVQELQSIVMEEDKSNIVRDESAMNTALKALCALGYEAGIVFNALQLLAQGKQPPKDAESYVRLVLQSLSART